jgi:hypothetical protein
MSWLIVATGIIVRRVVRRDRLPMRENGGAGTRDKTENIQV